ncbi:CaiB/BaiF CoA transferase family protein [Kribbia dieselivorans]|uniref:CaiB/BaiF CoA transferase family protein n=1 Tax=Kribbia dieselivorans TaxID=331526 RepID=UPI0008380453|nr:CaiB/BaiF CoA-transferase family protein [Kribbia dieselivorans]
MSTGPLAGLKVVELSGIGPGPFCAMMLADLGADVVRVHRVGDASAPNSVLDRGRRSVAVNLKDPRGVEVVRRLAADADVLIEGFRPGVLERLGLTPESLLEANPRLVVGRMTGYGQDGPLSPRAGHDINYISLSGALHAIGRPDSPPAPPLNLVGDFGGGGMLLAFGVVSAVLNARTTGQGQIVDAAMVEGASVLMAMMYGFMEDGDWTPRRGENIFDGTAPFYDTYACSDGRYMAVGAIEPQFFAILINTLGVADQIDAPRQRDSATWPHMREVFTAAFATRTRDEWTETFEDLDACVTPVLDMAEAADHRHNLARGTFTCADGGSPRPAPAPRFSGTPTGPAGVTPKIGEHTEAVLTERGYTGDEVAALRSEGVIS